MNIPDLYDHSSSFWTCQDMNIWTCVKVTQVISTTISGRVGGERCKSKIDSKTASCFRAPGAAAARAK